MKYISLEPRQGGAGLTQGPKKRPKRPVRMRQDLSSPPEKQPHFGVDFSRVTGTPAMKKTNLKNQKMAELVQRGLVGIVDA